MPERVNELNYEAVLLEIHDFMLALPTTWWAKRPSDTPMRTIKTIIHNMTKIKGNGILQHLNNIPKHSELNTYILRILKVSWTFILAQKSFLVWNNFINLSFTERPANHKRKRLESTGLRITSAPTTITTRSPESLNSRSSLEHIQANLGKGIVQAGSEATSRIQGEESRR